MAEGGRSAQDTDALAQTLGVLANPVRLDILDRLGEPRFAAELEAQLGLTRQALKKHLDQLVAAGLVEVRASRRGALPAAEYRASSRGLFAFKEHVHALALPTTSAPGMIPTRPALPDAPGIAARGAALLVVHGHRRGEWIPLAGRDSHTIGRDEVNDISVHWDPFASGRHATLTLTRGQWSVADLQARNGTHVNFDPLPKGATRALAAGDVLGIGRTLFVLRP